MFPPPSPHSWPCVGGTRLRPLGELCAHSSGRSRLPRRLLGGGPPVPDPSRACRSAFYAHGQSLQAMCIHSSSGRRQGPLTGSWPRLHVTLSGFVASGPSGLRWCHFGFSGFLHRYPATRVTAKVPRLPVPAAPQLACPPAHPMAHTTGAPMSADSPALPPVMTLGSAQ